MIEDIVEITIKKVDSKGLIIEEKYANFVRIAAL